MKVRQVRLERVVAIRQDRDVTEALRMFKENNVDVLAIIDEKGKCIGSLSDREVLLWDRNSRQRAPGMKLFHLRYAGAGHYRLDS